MYLLTYQMYYTSRLSHLPSVDAREFFGSAVFGRFATLRFAQALRYALRNVKGASITKKFLKID